MTTKLPATASEARVASPLAGQGVWGLRPQKPGDKKTINQIKSTMALSSRPTLKKGSFLGGTSMGSPLLGLRPT